MSQRRANLENKLKGELTQVRQKVKAGDESQLLVWVLPDLLAASQRPLRDHPVYGGRSPLLPEAKSLVIDWVDKVKNLGIRSIVSFLEDAQLERYYIRGRLGLHPDGLLGYYQSKRFEVRQFRMTDYQRPLESDLELALQAFDELPKPVLLTVQRSDRSHCASGSPYRLEADPVEHD